MGRATFTATVERHDGHRFSRGARQAKLIMLREFEGDLGPRLLRVSRQAAPEASGKLQRGLHSEVRLRAGRVGIEIRSTARSDTGYPYTGVTRVGHRSAYIEPRSKQALAFMIGGRQLIRKRVRGYHPSHDWAEDAHFASKPHVVLAARRIGRQLQAVVG